MKTLEFENLCRIDTDNGKHDYFDLKGNLITVPSATRLVHYYYPFEYDKNDKKALEMVNKGIERGNHVHKTMEVYLKTNIKMLCDVVCNVKSHFEKEKKAIAMWDSISKRLGLVEWLSETSLHNNLFCGTIDAMGVDKDNNLYLLDFKTTNWDYYDDKKKIVEKEALQLSLYEVLINKQIKDWYIVNPSRPNVYKIDETFKQKANEQKENILELLKKGVVFE